MDGSETVIVRGTAAGVRSAADAADAFSVRHRVPDPVRRSLLTVLDEVLSNIVRHGLAGRDGQIEVGLQRTAGQLVVTVVDPADPFDPLQRPPPDTSSPLAERRPGGLGIELVRRLTDHVGYERRDECNRLTLTWHAAMSSEGDHRAD